MDHTDREYQGRLEAMQAKILEMAGIVEEMIDHAVQALLQRDVALADRTIAMDKRVNALELEIDDLGLRTLARWQPMASDLRFVTLSFKMVTDIERIGDLAVNICERAKDFADRTPAWSWDEVAEMAQIARTMVHDAIEAFLASDAEKAQRVIVMDDEMDDVYERAFNTILSSMIEQSDELRLGIHGLSVAKWLERISDHATNLAEQVIYVVNGEDIRHPGTRKAGLSR